MTLKDRFIENTRLQKEWADDRNPDFPTGGREKTWWRCERGHEWQATPDSRIYSGRNCPYCANQAVQAGKNDITAMAPEMARLWHPTKNGTLKPTDISPGSRKSVWWQCERGHVWQAQVYSVKSGCGCPYCSGRNAIPGETDLATTHPHLIRFWSKKNTLSPSEITAGSHKKVWWICEKGHEWDALVGTIALEGSGCPYCAGKRAIPGETDLATVKPELLEEWDYEKNTVNPGEILPSTHEKAWWKCALGHSWQAVVFSRTREQSASCPYCTGRKVLPGFNDLATLKPKVAQEWYQPLNGELKPEDVTLGSNKKVWWQCSDGHVWQAYIYARARRKGTGCPVCAGVVKQRRSSIRDVQRPIKKAHSRTNSEKSPASVNA